MPRFRRAVGCMLWRVVPALLIGVAVAEIMRPATESGAILLSVAIACGDRDRVADRVSLASPFAGERRSDADAWRASEAVARQRCDHDFVEMRASCVLGG